MTGKMGIIERYLVLIGDSISSAVAGAQGGRWGRRDRSARARAAARLLPRGLVLCSLGSRSPVPAALLVPDCGAAARGPRGSRSASATARAAAVAISVRRWHHLATLTTFYFRCSSRGEGNPYTDGKRRGGARPMPPIASCKNCVPNTPACLPLPAPRRDRRRHSGSAALHPGTIGRPAERTTGAVLRRTRGKRLICRQGGCLIVVHDRCPCLRARGTPRSQEISQ